jgi:hypothetical protein
MIAQPDNVVIVRQHKALSELAAWINAGHAAGEAASLQGAKHFRQVGEWLIEAKEKLKHGDWLPWLEANVKFSRQHACRYMRLAKCNTVLHLDDAWRVLTGRDEEAIGDAHVRHNTGEHEWYTPPAYLDAARKVLGAFDLDPASSTLAQTLVRAKKYHTRDDDGLSKPWRGRIWLNPPYASGLVDSFIDKLVSHYEAGDVTAAIVLVNNATETEWFHKCAAAASAVCFPAGRVRFLDAEGNPGAPLQGQSLLSLGNDPRAFCEAFSSIGRCWRDVTK